MSRPVPEKDKPDFSNLDDEHIQGYRDMVTDLRGAFDFDPEVTKALTKAWKALSEECTNRICEKPNVVVTETKVLKKKLVRSPLMRRKLLTN